MSEYPRITAELKLHTEVITLDDEWSGVTDQVLRRKLQNRLNQRAARRRKATKSRPSKDQFRENNALISQVERNKKAPDLTLFTLAQTHAFTRWLRPGGLSDQLQENVFRTICQQSSHRPPITPQLENRLMEMQTLCNRLAKERDTAWLHPLPADHLLSLVYYNVCRALISNVATLGLDPSLMSTQEYPSPFLPLSPTASSAICSLPPALQPTKLQQTIAHHPKYDITPDPTMRDNFLRYGEENIDDVKLCLDIIGDGAYNEVQEAAGQAGFIVWGDPWDLMSWEVTEGFVRKWAWMLEGCVDLEVSTNRWREKRGVEPLRMREIIEEVAAIERSGNANFALSHIT